MAKGDSRFLTWLGARFGMTKILSRRDDAASSRGFDGDVFRLLNL
jgi:hypothetical protein